MTEAVSDGGFAVTQVPPVSVAEKVTGVSSMFRSR